MINKCYLAPLALALVSLPCFGVTELEARLTAPVVFARVPVSRLQGLQAGPLGMLRADICEGAELFVLGPGGRSRLLATGFHSACEPDSSFDGQKILFSGKRHQSDLWNIYEIGIDGQNLRQITRHHGNNRSPTYQSTLYTIVSPEPWYQLTFVSDAARQINEAGIGRATHLYSCRLDGSELRRLTFNPSSDLDPRLMGDGRILYSTWQRSTVRHGPRGRFDLFTINSDGSDVVLFSGERGGRIKQMPAITPNGLCVFVESDWIRPDGGGRLSAVQLRRNLHSHRSITGEKEGIFHSPSPLPDGSILVAHLPGGHGKTYGIFRFDPASGQKSQIFDDPESHEFYPCLAADRPEPDGRSSVVDYDHPTGELYCLNLNIHDLPRREWLTNKVFRRVRFLEAVTILEDELEAADNGSAFVPKRLLGEIPIEDDGSFFVAVPPNIPIQIQLLDEAGMALRTCSWIWVKNKEARGCIGCHEDGELTPPNRLVEAVTKPAIQLTLPDHKRRFVDFSRDIVPILRDGCAVATCHAQGDYSPDLSPNRDGSNPPAYALRLHRMLVDQPFGSEGSRANRWIIPGQARNSRLMWHIQGRITNRPWDGEGRSADPGIPVPGRPLLTPTQRQFLVEWIDLGAHGGNLVAQAAVKDRSQSEADR